MKAFQAHGTKGVVTAETANAAGRLFFETYPTARKCNIIEGVKDGQFFTVAYGPGQSPESYKDVTKKTLPPLATDKDN